MVPGVRVLLGSDTNEPAVSRSGEYFGEDDHRDLHLRPVITFMMRRPLEGSLLELEGEAEGTASDFRLVIFLFFILREGEERGQCGRSQIKRAYIGKASRIVRREVLKDMMM